MNPKILFVGGTFDRVEGSHPSKIVRQLAYGLYETVNSGTIKDLEEILEHVARYDALIWMPNISNGEEKFLPRIKEKAPHIALVSSKRNDNNKYAFEDLVSRALTSKSQLLIEVTYAKEIQTLIETGFQAFPNLRLIDPLGNVSEFTPDLEEFRCLLYERIQFLLKMKRIESVKIEASKCGSEAEKSTILQVFYDVIPWIEPQFLKAIQKYADKFHTLIHGTNENPRFMGNASFRCTKGGFPSQRAGNAIYVSKRNVDKRCLDADSFVAVSPVLEGGTVKYLGYHKPSVDTPIQVLLYQAFPKINFMLHAHVYHKAGIMTARYVPCGDIREVDEIVNVMQNLDANYYSDSHFVLNLKGHGCLLASSKVEDLLNQEDNFYARPIPELTLI